MPIGRMNDSPASALLLHGLVHRSLRHVVASFREKVIAPLLRLGEVDIFFHSWDVSAIHNPRGNEHRVAVETAEVARLLPEARGIFESQEEFDRTVDWERLFERNPMRHCTGSEEAARATLMNFRRALESQERGWRFFEEAKTRRYDRVVVTRPDLRFLEELGTSNIDQPTLNVEVREISVPRFHAWGGVNDRFAIGSEEVIRIWSNRSAFADGWLLKAGGESSEWLLLKWLERNGIKPDFLDFVFQRVRANGEVAEMDRGLRAAVHRKEEASLKNRGRSAKRERFLILARKAGTMAEGLRKVLEPLGKVEVIVDRREEAFIPVTRPAGDGQEENPPSTIFIPDAEADGFGGLMSNSASFPWITAWSRAMVHLSRTLEPDEAVWLVEDDVAGDKASFAELVELTATAGVDLAAVDLRTRDEDSHWPQWRYADGYFDEPSRGFQPLCRLSGRLVREVLAFRERHGRFAFHEVLFASLARNSGMSWQNWSRDVTTRHLLPTFRYRPEVRPIERGINHPVKDPLVHEAVCLFTDVSACERASFYEGGRRGSWYLEDFGKWKRMFITDQPVRVLEIGVSDGVSANLMLDELFIHPQSEVHGIDLYDADPKNPGEREKARENFENNARRGGHAGQLHLYEGISREVLAWMISVEGFWESFDFIHLNGASDAMTMLADACQAWDLFKVGGGMSFGGIEWGDLDSPLSRPSTGTDAFLTIYSDKIERLGDGPRIAVMKK